MTAETPPARPPMPATPREALGPPIREHVILDERTFTIIRPGESHRLLDHPFVQSAFAADEYMPYWADLWPAARMLAVEILLADPETLADDVLESCLYLLRDRLRAAAYPHPPATPAP